MKRFIPKFRPSAWLAAALAVSLPSAGCQTFAPKSTTTTTSSAGTSKTTGTTEPGGPKTEFHREVGVEQEFNVHVELARFHEGQGDNESAVLEYQKAVEVCERKGSAQAHAKLGPVQHSLAQRRLAAALDRMGRFAQAEPHYLKALKLAPRDPKVWNDAGYSYYLQNRLADAERSLKTADSLGPNNPLVQTNLGLVLAAEGKNDASLAAFCRAAGPAVGHANLGYILAAMGKTDLAREHYLAALDLQPQMTPAREALAKLAAPAAPPTMLAASPRPAGSLKALATTARPTEPVSRVANSVLRVRDTEVTRTMTPKAAQATPSEPLPALPAIPTTLAPAAR